MVQSCDAKLSYLLCCPNFCCTLQHNKQREELHRLQEKHPEKAVKAALQSVGHQVSGVEAAQQTESSDDEDEVCQALTSLTMTMHRKPIKPIKYVEFAIAPTLHHSDCAAQMCDTLCACCLSHIARACLCCSMHGECHFLLLTYA